MENLTIQQFGIALASGAVFMWLFYSLFMKGRPPMFTNDTPAKMRERELRMSQLKLEECNKQLEESKANVIWWESRKVLLEERTARLRSDVAEDKRPQSFDRVYPEGGQVPSHRPDPGPGEFINRHRDGAKVTRVAPPANP